MRWGRNIEGLRQGLAIVVVLACGWHAGCRAEAPWPLWESYAQKFLDNQGRVIDRTGQDRTTTEGEAYGMFFALVAGDRTRFDKLLQWTEDNLAGGDLTAHLPAWSWGKADDGSWRVLDSHPASDADLWMAYTLCEAGRLWKVPRYEKLGELMAGRVAQLEVVTVPGLGATLLPGAVGFHPDARTWLVNPSYMPPPLLVYFARRDPASPWKKVLQSLPAVLHAEGGFAMDWVAVEPEGVRASVNPAKLANGPSSEVPVGSYDAIRVYLWLGMSDPRLPEVKASMAEMHGMTAYMKGKNPPPERVDAGGKIMAPDGPVGFSAALIPFLEAQGMKMEERLQSDRLLAMRDEKNGLFGRQAAYYDQSLALFSLGWSEQRFRFESDGSLRLKGR